MTPTPPTGDVPHAPSAPATVAAAPPFTDVLRDAVWYWELRRIAYNLALAAVCIGWVIVTWPHFRGAFSPFHLGQLFVLAVLANLCYSAAYLVDLAFLPSGRRIRWRRHRWMLWLFGTVFALLLEYYWIGDEIYPSLR